MRGQVSPPSLGNPNVLASKPTPEPFVQYIPNQSLKKTEPQNMEESQNVQELGGSMPHDDQGMSDPILDVTQESIPVNVQTNPLQHPLYSNVSIVPYRSTWFTEYFQQVSKENKKKAQLQEYPSTTI